MGSEAQEPLLGTRRKEERLLGGFDSERLTSGTGIEGMESWVGSFKADSPPKLQTSDAGKAPLGLRSGLQEPGSWGFGAVNTLAGTSMPVFSGFG